MELEIPHLDNPVERRKLVRALALFRKMRKVSRARAMGLFVRMQHGVKESTIITGQDIDTSEKKYLLSLFKKVFPDAQKPTFSVRANLLGGVRMMYGDEMVELSLNQLK